MKLNQKAIEEFKAIYKKEFGEDLTDAEAQEMGQRLLRLFQIFSLPFPSTPPSSQYTPSPSVDSSLPLDNIEER